MALCAVPLVLQDRRLGALRFSFTTPRLFDEDERRFVLALAAQTSQALDRAQLNEERLDFGRRLQLSLLPRRLASPPHIEIAGVYHALGDGTELGGDIYDVWAMDGGRWGLAIADASGTGPEAAALTAMVRFSLRALSITDSSPVSVLDKVNRALLGAEVGGIEGDRFCTALFGVLTPGPTSTVALGGGGYESAELGPFTLADALPLKLPNRSSKKTATQLAARALRTNSRSFPCTVANSSSVPPTLVARREAGAPFMSAGPRTTSDRTSPSWNERQRRAAGPDRSPIELISQAAARQNEHRLGELPAEHAPCEIQPLVRAVEQIRATRGAPDAVILLKASRGMKLERLVPYLTHRPQLSVNCEIVGIARASKLTRSGSGNNRHSRGTASRAAARRNRRSRASAARRS